MAHWHGQGNRPHSSNPSVSRFTELLENLKQEFLVQCEKGEQHGSQLASQVQEMTEIRRNFWDLEQAQIQIKKSYEDEINTLRRELGTRGAPHHLGPGHHSQPPPQVGHGSSNHFGGIMSGDGAQGGTGIPPPPQEPSQPQGLPGHLTQGPPGPPSGLPQPPAYGNFPQQPSASGYPPQPPPATQPPGPAGRGRSRLGGPSGPAVSQQNSTAPYPGLPPGQSQSQLSVPPVPRNVGNVLFTDLEYETLPAQFKKEGDDWYAVFNPQVERFLDVELVHTIEHPSVVCSVRFSQDGRFVATGSNMVAQIFDVNTGECVSTLQDNSQSDEGDLYIRSVRFSPDGKYLATGSEDNVIRVWDISTSTIVHYFTGHDDHIYSLDYSRNGRMIASGSGDRTVRLWDLDSSQQILHLLIEDGITTVAISPDNRFVAAGSLDKSVRVWDTSGNMVERLEGEDGHNDSVYAVAFSPNGLKLVSGSLDKTIKMWDLAEPSFRDGTRSRRCARTFEGHKDFVLSVAFTPDNHWVLSGSKDRGVQFWDPHTGQAQFMLKGHKNSIISVAPSPTDDLFATGGGDLRARIWRYKRYSGP